MVAESGPAARQKRTKSSKSKKRKAPHKSTESASNPKWTCIEDVQDEVDVAEPSPAPAVVPSAIAPKLKVHEKLIRYSLY
jgi:hypothetical protein